MSNYIVCPDCGEKIYSHGQNKPMNAGIYKYEICEKCGSKYTALPDDVNVMLRAYDLMNNCFRSIFVVLYVGLFIFSLLEAENKLLLLSLGLISAALLWLVIGVLSAVIREIRLSIFFKKAQNGYMVSLDGSRKVKYINYISETQVTPAYESGEDSVIYSNAGDKNNYKASKIMFFPFRNVRDIGIYDDRLTVLIPLSNVKASMSAEDVCDLQLYYTYKIYIDNIEIFLVLTDYKIENNNTSVYFKILNKGHIKKIMCGSSYDLLSLDGEQTGSFTITEIKNSLSS